MKPMEPTIALLAIPKLNPKPIEFVRLEIDQCFNDHHRLKAVLDLERMGENVLSSPMQKTSLVNEKIIVDIQEGSDAGHAKQTQVTGGGGTIVEENGDVYLN